MSRLILSHNSTVLLPTHVRTTGTFRHRLIRPGVSGNSVSIEAALTTEHTDRHLNISVRIEGTTNSLSIPKTGVRDLVRKAHVFIEACVNGTLDTAEASHAA